ncbi:MAG: hypothetical protein AAGB46_09760 [Verrucomicrobiota bacterium]
MERNSLPYRQSPLGSHTPENIENVRAKLDPEKFVYTLKKANINSITLFEKYSQRRRYTPSRFGKPHPHLSYPDRLGEIAEAEPEYPRRQRRNYSAYNRPEIELRIPKRGSKDYRNQFSHT